MKKTITIVSLSLLAATAFAGGYGNDKGHGNNNTVSGPAIKINDATTQVTSMSWSAVSNKADNGGSAHQNLSSNTGNVTVNDNLLQVTSGKMAYVGNSATGGATATQNLASNIGKVDVNDKLTQVVALRNSAVINRATGGNSAAVQNVSTNNGCSFCK